MASLVELEDLFQNAPCGYVRLDAHGRIDASNRLVSVWTGLTAKALAGKRLRDLLTVGGRIFYETHFAPLLRMQGFFNEVALDLVSADGRPMPILVSAAEHRDAEDRLVATRVVLFSAGDRRNYERNLLAANDTSRAALIAAETNLIAEKETAQLREQFIAILGHDLRNPLAAISGGSRMLALEELSERGQRILGLLDQTVGRMSALIDNVLDFARGRLGGGLAITVANVKLAPVLEQVVTELAIGSARQIELTIDLPRPVDCDAPRIAQLVSNLLGNAKTHGAQDQSIQLKAEEANGVVAISVTNVGPPIDRQTMGRLFQPFFRGDPTARKQGLGLGLYIAGEIARAHLGWIEVHSDATETRFTFRMPVLRSSSVANQLND